MKIKGFIFKYTWLSDVLYYNAYANTTNIGEAMLFTLADIESSVLTTPDCWGGKTYGHWVAVYEPSTSTSY